MPLADSSENTWKDRRMAMIYDLMVIGDEQEGVERAIGAAEVGQRVVVIRSHDESVSIAMIRRGAEKISGSASVTMWKLREVVSRLIRFETQAVQKDMERLGIEIVTGQPQFISDSAVEIWDGAMRRVMTAEKIVVACGTESRQPASFGCDGHRVLVPESLLNLVEIPKSSVVVGAGTIGLSTAILLGRLGVEVTVVDENGSLLEICRALDGSLDEIPSLPIAFRLNDEVIGTTLRSDGQVTARLASGRVVTADTILICVGRAGKTNGLRLEAAAVGLDDRGRLWCDEQGQTWAPGITAVGDVAGASRQRLSTMTDRAVSLFSTEFA